MLHYEERYPDEKRKGARVSRVEEWAESSNTWDRCKAAKSKKCPEDTLARLRDDEDESVRFYSLLNSKTSLDLVKPAVQKWVEQDRVNRFRRILWRDDLTVDILNLIATVEPILVLSHPNWPVERKILVAREGTLEERKYLAKCRGLLPCLQDILVRDENAGVRRSLAGNKDINERTALTLKDDTSLPVLRNIIRHPAVAPHKQEIAARIMARWHGGRHSAVTLAQHSTDPQQLSELFEGTIDPYSIITMLKNPLLDGEKVEKACYSENEYVRKYAKKHPNCSEEGQIVVALLS